MSHVAGVTRAGPGSAPSLLGWCLPGVTAEAIRQDMAYAKSDLKASKSLLEKTPTQ